MMAHLPGCDQYCSRTHISRPGDEQRALIGADVIMQQPGTLKRRGILIDVQPDGMCKLRLYCTSNPGELSRIFTYVRPNHITGAPLPAPQHHADLTPLEAFLSEVLRTEAATGQPITRQKITVLEAALTMDSDHHRGLIVAALVAEYVEHPDYPAAALKTKLAEIDAA